MKLILFLIAFFFILNCNAQKNNKFKEIIVCQEIRNDSLLGYRKLYYDFENNNLIAIDFDTSHKQIRVKSNNKLFDSESLLATDIITHKILLNDTSNLKMKLKGKNTFTDKQFNVKVYFVELKLDNIIWKGEVECIDKLLITSRIRGWKLNEHGNEVNINHEYLLQTTMTFF